MKNFCKNLVAMLAVLLLFSFSNETQAQTFNYLKATNIFEFTKNPGTGKVLTSNASGRASWQDVSSTSIVSAVSRTQPASGDTVSLVVNTYNIIDAATSLNQIVFRLPSSPSNGAFVEIKTVNALDTITYINGSISAGILDELQTVPYLKAVYSASDSTWY
jgi:hypothetical protein